MVDSNDCRVSAVCCMDHARAARSSRMAMIQAGDRHRPRSGFSAQVHRYNGEVAGSKRTAAMKTWREPRRKSRLIHAPLCSLPCVAVAEHDVASDEIERHRGTWSAPPSTVMLMTRSRSRQRRVRRMPNDPERANGGTARRGPIARTSREHSPSPRHVSWIGVVLDVVPVEIARTTRA